jgi:hypothetical protein
MIIKIILSFTLAHSKLFITLIYALPPMWHQKYESINKHKLRGRKNSKSSLPSKVQYVWQLIIIKCCLLKDEFMLEKRNMYSEKKREFRLSERNARALLNQSCIKLEICQYKCQVYAYGTMSAVMLFQSVIGGVPCFLRQNEK